ncbi:hypothetical protein EON62_04250, partial [archaeon]
MRHAACVGTLPPRIRWAARCCVQTMAVSYIHKHRVLHRDLKSQNVFLTSMNMVRLGDFGIARVLEHTMDQAKTVVGTPYYMAPEICQGKSYNEASDMWALGCVLYEMLTLNHAFQSSNLLGLVYKIVEEKQPPIPAHYSEFLSHLVDVMLSKNPAARMDADHILQLPIIAERIRRLASMEGTTAGLMTPMLRPMPAPAVEGSADLPSATSSASPSPTTQSVSIVSARSTPTAEPLGSANAAGGAAASHMPPRHAAGRRESGFRPPSG